MPDLTSPRPILDGDGTLAFDSGKPPLDEFLKLHALAKQTATLSRSYVVTDGSRVVGYYTLALVTVQSSETPKKMGRGMPNAIPAMLMARFAVDLAYQGHGLGRFLFTDGIRRTWAVMASGPAPVRLFVAEAKDDAARTFYERFDMVPSPVDPRQLFLSHRTLRNLF